MIPIRVRFLLLLKIRKFQLMSFVKSSVWSSLVAIVLQKKEISCDHGNASVHIIAIVVGACSLLHHL